MIIGYNIQYFDIPFITARAFKHDQPGLALLMRRMYRADLMHIVSRYLNTSRRYLKLNDVARFLGVKHDTISGSMVPELYRNGDMQSIVDHCLADIHAIYQISSKLRYLIEHNIERRYDVENVNLEGL